MSVVNAPQNGDSNVPVLYNINEWIEENKKLFLPPVCNKMMHHKGQMKAFFVGGPNQRKDYHFEAGEELFYQVKGDMVLKIVEKGKHRDITIKEGEIFLLPCRMLHSPQRFKETVGLVIERERHPDTEKDALRYYIENDGKPTLDLLYEDWFYCTDLGDLGPIIKRFFASEQYKTGKPIPGTIPDPCPLVEDTEKEVQMPFSLQGWIDDHREEIDRTGKLAIFDCVIQQFQVYIYGKGQTSDQSPHAESLVWQLEGESTVTLTEEYKLRKSDSLLIPKGKRFTVQQDEGSLSLVCYQNPTKANTWPKE